MDNANFRNHLTQLYLETNQLSDILALSNLTNLQVLYLNENQPLTNIDSLTGLNALTELNLSLTQIANLNSLAGKQNLRSLSVSVIPTITDFSPLSTLTNLEADNDEVGS